MGTSEAMISFPEDTFNAFCVHDDLYHGEEIQKEGQNNDHDDH